MSSGKRPLHGTRLFVSIAMSRSRGEVDDLATPVTPQALQPDPCIVRLCRRPPGAGAKRGRARTPRAADSPRHSSSVKSGKKIAIGGSITDTTRASVRYIPSTSAPRAEGGRKAELPQRSCAAEQRP